MFDIRREWILDRLRIQNASCEDLVDKSGLDPSKVADYLNGKKSLSRDDLESLAKVLGVNVAALAERLYDIDLPEEKASYRAHADQLNNFTESRNRLIEKLQHSALPSAAIVVQRLKAEAASLERDWTSSEVKSVDEDIHNAASGGLDLHRIELGAEIAEYNNDLKRISNAAKGKRRYSEEQARKDFKELRLWAAIDNSQLSRERR